MVLDPALVGLGFGVGIAIGLTGIGGGSLLTPLLILVVGVRPLVAVGSDLAFAAVTKVLGAWQHRQHDSVDLRLTFLLAGGSLPGSVIGVQLVGLLEAHNAAAADAIITRLLGGALLAAAGASLLRASGLSLASGPDSRPGPLAAPLIGLIIGILVGMTSIGAGALLMAVFSLFYGISPKKAVGTDITHGALLAVVAASAHGTADRIDWEMLTALLGGSLPGVLVGGWLCHRLPVQPVRLTVTAMLAFAGLRLL